MKFSEKKVLAILRQYGYKLTPQRRAVIQAIVSSQDCSPEYQHHLICSTCGKVVDFAGCDLGELEQRLSKETGFDIEDYLLEFVGLCHACQKEAA